MPEPVFVDAFDRNGDPARVPATWLERWPDEFTTDPPVASTPTPARAQPPSKEDK